MATMSTIYSVNLNLDSCIRIKDIFHKNSRRLIKHKLLYPYAKFCNYRMDSHGFNFPFYVYFNFSFYVVPSVRFNNKQTIRSTIGLLAAVLFYNLHGVLFFYAMRLSYVIVFLFFSIRDSCEPLRPMIWSATISLFHSHVRLNRATMSGCRSVYNILYIHMPVWWHLWCLISHLITCH